MQTHRASNPVRDQQTHQGHIQSIVILIKGFRFEPLILETVKYR